MVLVTAVFLVQAFRFIVLHKGVGGLFTTHPIYDPATFNLRALAAGTSFAASCSSDLTAFPFSPKK